MERVIYNDQVGFELVCKNDSTNTNLYVWHIISTDLKTKSHIIISMDAEKPFGKTQHLVFKKKLST